MPGFDGTGPRGMGPITGGGRGFCSPWGIGGAFAGYGTAPRVGYGYPYYGRAGAFYPFYGAPTSAPGATPFAPTMTREQELDFLKNQAQAMRGQLGEIESRIQELGSKSE
jgi:hypothetical protein